MQAKMAGRSRLANRIYQRLFAIWVPMFGWGVKNLSLGALYAWGSLSLRIWLACKPKYARVLRANFAQILGVSPNAPDARALARRMTVNLARYWIDFFYWSERGGEAARAQIRQVENLPALERCLKDPRGFIALTAHLGNWEMGGMLLGDRNRQLAVVYVPDRFELLERYRSTYRRAAGVIEVPITSDPLSVLAALRVLRDGGVVAVQGDRDFNDSGLPVTFFGRTAWFPRGPAMLSLLSRAPILPVFILREPDGDVAGSGGFRIVVYEAIEPAGDARDPAAVTALTRRIVAVIEEMVRRFPEQWYCFYPVWDAPPPSSLGSPDSSPSSGGGARQSARGAPTAAT